jgi:hypothetical protein
MKAKITRALTRKTILAFGILLVASILEVFLGVDVPGVELDSTTAGAAIIGILLRLATSQPATGSP